MGIAKIYNQKQSGLGIRGIIEDYYVYAGEKVSAGDFVEFVNGVAGQRTETSISTEISNQKYSAYSASAVALDDNRVFIAHNVDNSYYYLYGIVCTIEGATITAGTDTQLSTESSTGFMVSATLLKDGNVFIAHSYGSNFHLYGMVCSINGTSITAGTDTSIYTSTYAGYKISTQVLSDGEVFIAHSGSGTNYYLYYTVCKVSGTTVSISISTTLKNSSARSGMSISTVMLPNGNVFVVHGAGSYAMRGVIASKSGTTITEGTTVQLSTQTYTSPGQLVVLDGNRIFIPHSYSSSGYMRITVAKVSGTTISEYQSTENLTTSANSGNSPRAILMPSGKILVIHNIGGLIYGMVCTVDDMTVTTGVDTNMSSTQRAVGDIFLLADNIFVVEGYTSDYLLYTQLFNIDETNNIPTTQVKFTEYETQVRKATTSDIYGVAKTSGMGAYKTFEYTIPEGESVNKGEGREYSISSLIQGDIFPKTWTRENSDYTLYTSEEFTLTANSIYQTGSAVDKLCNGSLTDYWCANTGSYYDIAIMELPEATKITKMKTSIVDFDNFEYATIEGSNDNSLWTELYRETSTHEDLIEIILNNTDYYKYYKLKVGKKDDGGIIGVREWQVSEYIGLVPQQGIALQSGTAGDTIQIAVPITDEESTGHKDIVSIYKPPYSVYNLITNGDFSNGLEGWDIDSSVSAEVINEAGENIIKTINITPVGYGWSNIQQSMSYIENHKYYISAYMRGSSSNKASSIGLYALAFGYSTNQVDVTTNDWVLGSNIIAPTNNGTNFTLRVPNNTDDLAGNIGYFKNIKLFDLTEMFGAGNEPTKEWCDINL